MSTEVVFTLFPPDHQPTFLEWINDSSCNVIFEESRAALDAYLAITKVDEAGVLQDPLTFRYREQVLCTSHLF
jgi:hypothetical protein